MKSLIKLSILILLLLITPVAAETGIASWYGAPFHGRKTASGERYNMNEPTCAHRKHPFGTLLRVTAVNGQWTHCRVNDRGPFVRGRIVDVSRHGAHRLGIINRGLIRVRIEVLSK